MDEALEISDSESDGFSTPSIFNYSPIPVAAALPSQPKDDGPQTSPSSQQLPKPLPTHQTPSKPASSSSSAYNSSASMPAKTPSMTKTTKMTPLPPTVGKTLSPEAILQSLNEAQKRAVTSTADTLAILAGPGSGKTHTLTSRVVWLVDVLGYRPQDIIVSTFTVKAAREMKERVGKALGDGRERKIVLGTFHSIARRYLATYGKRIGLDPHFSIVDDADSKAIITRIMKRTNLEGCQLEPAGVRAWISKEKVKSDDDKDEDRPGQQKRNPIPARVLQKMREIRQEYQAHLERQNLLDYDDLLVKGAELLRRHPSCVSNVQAVLVDEYQDTNGIQYDLMKLFGQARRRINVVGDPDQSIYGWRSAEIRNLFRFLHDFPRTEEVSLEENYRSSRSILDTSLAVIQQDTTRYKKSLLPIHKSGARPVLRKLQNASAEAAWMVSEMRRTLQLCGALLDLNDVAVLVRSAALSRPIEAQLNKARLPYRMIGGLKFFERAEIKVVVDYLRVIHQPDNSLALARIINVPRRGVGVKNLKALVEEAEVHKMSLWQLLTLHMRGTRPSSVKLDRAEKRLRGFLDLVESLRAWVGGAESKNSKEADNKKADNKGTESKTGTMPCTLPDLIQRLLERLNFPDYLMQTYGEEHESRWANVEELQHLALEFMRNQDEADDDELPEVEGEEPGEEETFLEKFLATVSLATEAEINPDEEKKPMVTISTIHAAKGLEWPVVFIPAAYTGSLPHSRSEDFNEERRLLYVAMTRAKCLLNISYPLYGRRERKDYDDDGYDPSQELSLFLAPVPSACFLDKGPSIDAGLLGEMGAILGRPVPSAQDIYKNIPAGSQLEDDSFPIDPEDQYSQSGDGGGPQTKRQRTMGVLNSIYSGGRDVGGGAGGAGGDYGSWQRGYRTTMESTSSFSVSHLPGFVTASAHQAALAAAEPAAEAGPPARGQKRKLAAAPAGQQTITSIFCRNLVATSGSEGVAGPPPQSGPWARQIYGRDAPRPPPGISPELTGRRLGQQSAAKANIIVIDDSDTEKDVPKKRYAHFSSSPTRVETPALQQQQQQLSQFHRHYIPPGQSNCYSIPGKENRVMAGTGKGGAAAGAGPRPTAMRPAATFHRTSYTQAGGGSRNSVKADSLAIVHGYGGQDKRDDGSIEAGPW